MSILLDPLPSGSALDTLSKQVVTDLGLVIDGSGIGSIDSEDLVILFEKSLSRLNRCLETCFVLDTGEIKPSPSKAHLDLIMLQTECLLHKRKVELSTGTERGVKRVKLEDIEVEFDSIDKSKNLDAKFGYCQELEDALLQFKSAQNAADGASIIWDRNSRRWEEVDHDGTTGVETHYDHRDDGNKHPGVDPGNFDGGPTNRFGS